MEETSTSGTALKGKRRPGGFTVLPEEEVKTRSSLYIKTLN